MTRISSFDASSGNHAIDADRHREAARPEGERPTFRMPDKAQAPRADSPAPESGGESPASPERPRALRAGGFRQQTVRYTGRSDHPVRAGFVQFAHNLDITARDILNGVGIPVEPAAQEVRVPSRSDHPVRAHLRQIGYDVRVTALDIGLSTREVLAGPGQRYDRPIPSLLAGRITELLERRETPPLQAAQAVPVARPATGASPQRTRTRLEPVPMVQARSAAEVEAMERERASQAMQAARQSSQPLQSLLPPFQQQIPLAPPPPQQQHRSPAMSLNEQVRLLPDVPDHPVGWADPSLVLPDVPGASPLASPILTRH